MAGDGGRVPDVSEQRAERIAAAGWLAGLVLGLSAAWWWSNVYIALAVLAGGAVLSVTVWCPVVRCCRRPRRRLAMPERAEIEAVRHDARFALAEGMHPVDAAIYAAGRALDRVRDARGDDEAPKRRPRVPAPSGRPGSLTPPVALSPQGEDHEAGIEAAAQALIRLHSVFEPSDNNFAWVTARHAVAAYLSHVSPSRDGTVAVEDVERLVEALEWTVTRYEETLAGRSVRDADECLLHSRNLLAEFGSACAGESNEGGNQ
jgi:hypothetical protein